ncbi:MAG: bifunctional 4-hydroxy-2-oxoglutarate aldolase/2-dehydro-3-deoxy-phosphogluconate aldolase [Aminobacterium sp.]|jgi:2-dehydro-3-deoxyphosphogluconate aldolase/(4S)-4-hydroxy-2-oxoglutarate aldolase|uniref:bifunctional 4-hydroxy-2-oxoglutarate aldolase/2-dehydro-3-deoxy-phosphogluconate aldolase n=1 Tax=unclassified Aminobacterium TaxID=2685012 RepID=UPI001BCBA419|nr:MULTISPECIES: bifunctional 4-hydroxy-2-oxoglutarate aldolase/2-dehydro-3-deoxy-phosphogluconate aldolase [unclassified Aminobacterium]MDD2207585.1 bifunctional 4-hydroxy-2-oxoglutarate aldolase/2-dehydro-3-deoxy-phosphogluconate aldolase [Aminobacterium sp.]MDD3708221.1 bifunctional 4-hydroxy-2-oxoglutarate aldolase/2-dehydro-3-deoxy-phosphogluconate aldolase [Aminobacterium sp.]MDD4229557.1 bifunctional 4-hydroxy-2-oxoglutarate aldolase/2-dehydro-3-deoxy-phosphogluconate aldolase [Aminobacte
MTCIKKYEVLSAVEEQGIVGIIRTENIEKGIAMADAMFDGGLKVVEVSMTFQGALDIMRTTAERHKGKDRFVGAGTVVDEATARMCIVSGSEFVVSQSLHDDVVRTCNRYGLPCMPGIGTVSELMHAMELGVDVVKAFPGSVLGPQFIKAVHGPVPYANIMPVGGVSLDNMKDWFKAGAFAVGLGSALTKPSGTDGGYDAVRETTEKVLEEIARIRASLK